MSSSPSLSLISALVYALGGVYGRRVSNRDWASFRAFTIHLIDENRWILFACIIHNSVSQRCIFLLEKSDFRIKYILIEVIGCFSG